MEEIKVGTIVTINGNPINPFLKSIRYPLPPCGMTLKIRRTTRSAVVSGLLYNVIFEHGLTTVETWITSYNFDSSTKRKYPAWL